MALAIDEMARLGELLDQSLLLSLAERRKWLESLPVEDRRLIQSLRETLLSEDPAFAASGPLDLPPRIHDPDFGDEGSITRRAGERLGAYELLRPLGSGGMAEVWLARRSDGAFEREVALKIPRLRGMPEEMVNRFARECGILASLEYPGIARLYDAGVDDSGVPYIAMEYVQGEPLVAWCNTRNLDVPARIRIFLQVLDAVGHAHAHQVLHRDLKPSNILVTERGEVRLLDFGVARLLLGGSEGPLVTHVWGPALTPGYASPELLHGEPVDLRSDIYSLGVVLHELLTGMRPREILPAASSNAAGALRGVLREATLKALAPVPADRYADTATFAEALRIAMTGPRLRVPQSFVQILAGTMASLVVAGAMFWWLRPQEPTPTISVTPPAVVEPMALLPAADVPLAESPQATSSVAVMHAPTKPAARAITLAVLPFANLTGIPEHDDISDGLMLGLADRLAEVPGLVVKGRLSNLYLKGKGVDSASIASALDVSTVVQASLRNDDGKLIIAVQVIDGGDTSRSRLSRDYGIGSGSNGAAAVEGSITSDIAKALSLNVDAARVTRALGGTISDEAAAGFWKLRKIRFEDRRGPDTAKESERLLRAAVEHDDGFVLAWDALASVLQEIASEDGKDEAEAKRLQAESELARDHVHALAPPDSWIVLRSRSDAALRAEKWEEALAYARRVRESGPPTLERIWPLMSVLFSMGYLKETIDLQQEVIDLEPQSLWMSREQQWNLYGAGRLAESQEEYLRSKDLEGDRRDLEYVARLRLLANEDTDPDVLRSAYLEAWGPTPEG